MKKFSVSIFRTVRQLRTLTINAETEEQAREFAMEIVTEKDGGWEGKDYDAKYEVQTKEIQNDYIDRYGNPYDPESDDACWPAGGGLHKDCEFNADALYAYYTIGDRYKIADYLLSKGFKEILHGNDEEVWIKRNTQVVFECYDRGAHLWGYMHTELV